MERAVPLEKTKVLVIDDDRSVCNVVAEVLLAEDIEVLQAHDGAEGLSLARGERPDLIILDVMMPVMSGYDVCRSLRGSFLTANIPVIMLTALGDPMERVKGMAEGADDYLTKPFHPHELRSRVIAHLRRSERDIQTSPLTRLPGNLAVERALRERVARQEPFAVCYIDLDNFKPYNDKYGFFAGDQVLRMLSEIIVDAVLERGAQEDFIGHEGGDDFVVITTPERVEGICQAVIERFDAAIPQAYDEEDRERAYILSRDRLGRIVHFPLLTVSISVVTNVQRSLVHPGQIAHIAAQVMRYVKAKEGSNYAFDRRKG
ncbi:MAG: response regulator [Anaerolineae bacterium]